MYYSFKANSICINTYYTVIFSLIIMRCITLMIYFFFLIEFVYNGIISLINFSVNSLYIGAYFYDCLSKLTIFQCFECSDNPVAKTIPTLTKVTFNQDQIYPPNVKT